MGLFTRLGLICALGLGIFAGPVVQATTISNILRVPLSFKFNEKGVVQSVRYKCVDQPASLRSVLPKGVFSAAYINLDDISLLAVSIHNKTQIFSNVVSASGAKYAAGSYEWWEDHGEVSFSDTEQGKVLLTCKEIR
nr:MliC family protein [uncultured Neokomagataea sp.]